jgi:stearoyl-CoA desaturase (delta-9 desaturase)
MGWIVCDKYNQTRYDLIEDYGKYPEMHWLNNHDAVGFYGLGAFCVLWGVGPALWTHGFGNMFFAGLEGLWIGFFASTLVLWHSTFTINSLAHRWGHQYYETGDTSRNNFLLALINGGEGWHNNHHKYPRSAKQGFRRWWQVDTTYYGLWCLSKLGIVKNLQKAPAAAFAPKALPITPDR